MSVSVTRLPEEPIIVVRVTEQLNLLSIRTLVRESADLCAGMSSTVYRVIDVFDADASINELARALVEAKGRTRGSVLDSQIVSVLVARPNRMRFIADLLARKEFGGLDMPVYDSLDEALASLRADIAAGQGAVAKA